MMKKKDLVFSDGKIKDLNCEDDVLELHKQS